MTDENQCLYVSYCRSGDFLKLSNGSYDKHNVVLFTSGGVGSRNFNYDLIMKNKSFLSPITTSSVKLLPAIEEYTTYYLDKAT